jgi:hypothetical protein
MAAWSCRHRTIETVSVRCAVRWRGCPADNDVLPLLAAECRSPVDVDMCIVASFDALVKVATLKTSDPLAKLDAVGCARTGACRPRGAGRRRRWRAEGMTPGPTRRVAPRWLSAPGPAVVTTAVAAALWKFSSTTPGVLPTTMGPGSVCGPRVSGIPRIGAHHCRIDRGRDGSTSSHHCVSHLDRMGGWGLRSHVNVGCRQGGPGR